MSRIQDYMDDPWWNMTYRRYAKHDPSNRNYGTYDTHGLNTQITIASNPEFATQMKGYQNGIDKYKVGGVSLAGVKLQSQINACSSQTGMPNGCAVGYLSASGVSPHSRGSVMYDNVYDRM